MEPQHLGVTVKGGAVEVVFPECVRNFDGLSLDRNGRWAWGASRWNSTLRPESMVLGTDVRGYDSESLPELAPADQLALAASFPDSLLPDASVSFAIADLRDGEVFDGSRYYGSSAAFISAQC